MSCLKVHIRRLSSSRSCRRLVEVHMVCTTRITEVGTFDNIKFAKFDGDEDGGEE